ncbi:kinase-like protein [Aspergillus ruber CBS 135680]|uniref:Kinase-like protein n=1 Tax=Aspergillus ruber (strain CBS 135680) TaxID=1388766 RepID=A0A017SLK7_ASPRC|nr:kinase-like protein [Aspergillus ruber CBS 135680]EYE97646.1 kinase-like protein [Aspergillus ruber CBS 135680]
MWHRLGLRKLLGREQRDTSSSCSPCQSRPQSYPVPGASSPDTTPNGSTANVKPHENMTRRLTRRVGVGLPRATTFKRQVSEQRDRLEPFEPPEPRRAASADRRRPVSSQTQGTKIPQPAPGPRTSAPEMQWREQSEKHGEGEDASAVIAEAAEESETTAPTEKTTEPEEATERTMSRIIEMELEKRWILNLTMHFRDRSRREKLFVTYAETPTLWRRVTVSCDYRSPEPDSLEQDLSEMWNQKDRCARIYESLRESLAEIQFYDTVTNLKLETRDGRLHVHVTEDVNETIAYPAIFHIGHLPGIKLVSEDHLHFVRHESGFVYHVELNGRSFIKKEIPGPDMVDEFLYEINALHELLGAQNVIQLEAIVMDEERQVIKGLLIGYADKGALVDMLYYRDGKNTIPWKRRERWAKQIVQGLAEIHEAGFVQGDFTLSNIVLDGNDDAKIIDINRRGCPVGWEPPEIVAKLESKQRISMYIGVKTDLFQLGMTLWAVATENDEPERQCRPLLIPEDIDIPDYYRRLVAICMSPYPQQRLSAKELLTLFPPFIPPTSHALPMVYYPPPPTGMGVGPRTSHPHPHPHPPLENGFAYLHSRAGSAEESQQPQSPGQQHPQDDGYSSMSRQSHSDTGPRRVSYIQSDGEKTRSVSPEAVEEEPKPIEASMQLVPRVDPLDFLRKQAANTDANTNNTNNNNNNKN